MKAFTLVTLATAVSAHSIFQRVSVNGVDQGQLKGVRAPGSNYPIENVNHASFACNANIQHKDNTIINVPAGARVGAWWQHEIGGPSGPNDQDNPIAASHKGMFFFLSSPFSVFILTLPSQAPSRSTSPRSTTPPRLALRACLGSRLPSAASTTACGRLTR
jgi:hypothetical protein